MAKISVRDLNANTIIVSSGFFNYTMVHKPTFFEKLRGISWQDKVDKVVAAMEEQMGVVEKFNLDENVKHA